MRPVVVRRDGSASVASEPSVQYTAGGSRAAWYGSPSYLRMWAAQVASSTGDWVGIIAVTALSNRIGGPSATGFTLAARFLPAFFLAPICGLIVDRLDRKKVMVICDVARAALTLLLPFQTTVLGLVVISFLLEFLNLLWGPAKDASLPNLVEPEKLEMVATMNMAAAYGSFPFAAGFAAALFAFGEQLRSVSHLAFLRTRVEAVPIAFDVLTFLISAALIATIRLPKRVVQPQKQRGLDFSKAFMEIAEGVTFIRTVPVVRAVMIGMGTALIGGGLVIPLGRRFADQVLGAGNAGYSLLLFSLGTGAALGVLGITVLARFFPGHLLFSCSVGTAGISLLLAASTHSLSPAVWCVGGFGLSAGGGFVLANTILQREVDDALRGRVFASFYAIIRLALTIPLLLGPFLTALFDRVAVWMGGADRRISFGSAGLDVPGVRLTMWLGAVVVIVAAFRTFGILGIRVSDVVRSAAEREPETT